MCGIAGLFRQTPISSDRELLGRMLHQILHRGPDEEGLLIDGQLSMGMRRLSIIDLQEGTQPIYNETGRYGVVFNGEIYNYRELRENLRTRGHQLKTNSDTETIVHLYEDYREECLSHLRGMFGLAVWDNQNRELFIARDRLGIKPLYYTQVEGCFIFASEIKSILAHPGVKREVDLVSLGHYLSLKYVPGPRTLFAGIYSLEPGYWLRVKDGQIIQKQCYWDISFTDSAQNTSLEGCAEKSEETYADELQALLRESVALHLRSDVPFGAFLSGGLDSSLIVALMAEQLASPVKTFSVGFDGHSVQDELPYARQVAEAFGCEHHTLRIGSKDFLNLAADVLWHLDQPIADQATIATYMVAKLARQHVKMVLTGEGGDELFAGYARYAGERLSPYTRHLPPLLGRTLRHFAERMPGLRRAKIAIGALTIPEESKRMANWFPMFKDDAKQQLLSERLLSSQSEVDSLWDEHLSRCDTSDPVNRMLYVDSKLWLVDYLLLRGDKLTMANSLEARVPLLDHHVVEYAARLPGHMKLRGSTRKFLLKLVGRRMLPPSIINRKKQGFPIPIDQWLRHEATELMQDLLSEQKLRARGYFQPHYVKKIIRQHLMGYADHATELWGLMSFEMWMQRFIDNDTHSPIRFPKTGPSEVTLSSSVVSNTGSSTTGI
jgi:asparagine synthase (glutamine-hydrolysing)